MMNSSIKSFCKTITTNKCFELAIVAVILVNSLLIGVETYVKYDAIGLIQTIILYVFTIEIAMRFVAANSIKSFLCDGWNLFDLSLVMIGYIPETVVANASMMMALRVLRVFRVLRLLRTSKEIKVIITVLIKSMTSMFYNIVLFLIFVYLYAIIGVGLFKLPDAENLDGAARDSYEKYMEVTGYNAEEYLDPFGTLGEGMFSLFRELSGDGWTDFRYDELIASKYGLIKASPAVINIYHISWFVLAAFLLLNLVTGAIINNYENVMEHNNEDEE